jgi:hypothetical protein
MRCYRDIKTLAAIVACAPDSSLPIVHVRLSQLVVASGTHKSFFLPETIFNIDVPALNVFNKGTFLNIERLAVWTTVSDGDTA